MKKFEEMKFVKPNLKQIEIKFDQLISSFENSNSFEEQLSSFKKVNKYIDHLFTISTIGEIQFTCDTESKINQKNQEYMNNLTPQLGVFYNRFNKAILNAKYRPQLEEKYGPYLFKKIQTQIETFNESIIPNMQEIYQLSSEYTKVVSSAKIEFRGNTYNLAQLGKFAQDTDRDTRKEASLLAAKFFQDNNEVLGEIYDKLVKARHQMAVKLGYKNFIELGYKLLGRTDYNAEMVKNYRDQIYKDLVPLTKKLFKEQANRLGIKNPQFYDYNVMFNSGNATPKGSKDYLVNKAEEMYSELSKETDVFFKFLEEYHLLDLEARSGKSGGGYMTYLPDYKAPFIFSNFNGTSGDVDVLTHEFGHAFQGYESRNIDVPDYRSPTAEACEIHSMSMEFITYPWMEKFFKEDANKYRYSHLVSAINFIPYGVTVDEFQHWVYENPNATHLERCSKWREIEKKYLPHKKYKESPILEQGGWWLRQGHIFFAPFYYIDYTLAQVVAFQFFVEANKNHQKAWKKYVKLCKLGGKYPFTELLERTKLNNPFIDGNVKKVIRPLKKYLSSFDTNKL